MSMYALGIAIGVSGWVAHGLSIAAVSANKWIFYNNGDSYEGLFSGKNGTNNIVVGKSSLHFLIYVILLPFPTRQTVQVHV